MKERRRRMNKRQEKEMKLRRIWRSRKFEIILFWLDLFVHGTAQWLAITSVSYPKAWVWNSVDWQHKSWRQENLIRGFILIKFPDLRNVISDQISGRWKSFRSLQPWDDLWPSRRADRPIVRAGVSDHGRSSDPELTAGTPGRSAVSRLVIYKLCSCGRNLHLSCWIILVTEVHEFA